MKKFENTLAKDLPITTAAWRLIGVCDKAMLRLDKDHKHTFGRELVANAFRLLSLIAAANAAKGTPEQARRIAELLDCYYVVANTIKYLADGKTVGKDQKVVPYLPEQVYVESIPALANFERQAVGWYKKSQAGDLPCQRADGTAETNIT